MAAATGPLDEVVRCLDGVRKHTAELTRAAARHAVQRCMLQHAVPAQRRLVSRRDARGVKSNLVRAHAFALLDIFQPPTPATDPPFPLLCVEKMTILSFAVPPSSPAPYSSRPGTASKTAAPLGPTARTTTDRRAQPFSLPDSCGGHRRPPGRLMTARYREAAHCHAERLKRAPLPRPPPPSRKEASSSRSHSSGSSASSSLPDSSRNGFTLRLARRASTAAAGRWHVFSTSSSSPLLLVLMAAAKRSHPYHTLFALLFALFTSPPPVTLMVTLLPPPLSFFLLDRLTD